MRSVILQEFMSLDGRIAGPDDSVDFVPASTSGDRSFGQRQLHFMDSIDAILLGRVTYEMFSQYWPNVTSGDDRPFAHRINEIPKIVFSRTLERAPWGNWPEATIMQSDAATEVARLKRQPGKDMVIWGSISLAQSLMKDGAIDEYQLIVCPLALGTGRSLFRDGADSTSLKLVQAQTFDHGTVLLAYTARSGEYE